MLSGQAATKRLRIQRALLYCALLMAAACSGPLERKPQPEDVLWHQKTDLTAFGASPEGRLFLASGGAVLYADKPDYTHWRQVAPVNEVVIDLVSPSSDALFVVLRSSVLRFSKTTDGWTNTAALPAEKRLFVLESWARSSDDFYITGSNAAIVHFDGRDWTREQNPLDSVAALPSPEVLYSDIWAVGGTPTQSVYAASRNTVMERVDGVWVTRGKRPPGGEACNVTALIVSVPNDPMVAGFEPNCLYQITAQGWVARDPTLLSAITGSARSRVQADGSTLLWDLHTGTVIHVAVGAATNYRFPNLRGVVGVALAGDTLFAGGIIAGANGPESAVIRAPLSLSERRSHER